MTARSDEGLPRKWRRLRLAEVVREAQGGFASGQRDAKGVIQLRMNNVNNRGQFDWSSFVRVPADSRTVEVYRLRRGDILFNNTNSVELVGKSAMFEDHEEPVVFSNHFTRLRTTEEDLAPGFLALWLQAQWQMRLFEGICDRWIGQSAVQRDKLLDLEIPLPSLSEQNYFVAVLRKQMDAVEIARKALGEEIEALGKLPTALLRRVFDGEL